MSLSFVVFIEGDEKENILYPPIYGPFKSVDAANLFIEMHPRCVGGDLEPINGGYAAAHIVNAEVALDPAQALSEWDEWRW